MNSVATHLIKDYCRLNDSNISISCRVFEPSSSSNAKHRATVVEWINDTLPHLSFSINASDEELRAFLVDGSVLCQLLNKLEPDLVTQDGGSSHSWELCSENVGRFLSGMDNMGLPRFHPSDLEYGSMKIVVDCLLTLKTHFMPNVGAYKNLNMHTSNLSGNASNIRWKEPGEHFGCGDAPQRLESSRSHSPLSSREEMQNSDSKFKRTLHTPVMADSSAALVHQVGHRFQEVFQVKQGSYADLLPAKVSEVMKSNCLDNAPTHSLLSVVSGILDESTERKNGGVPERVACLLRKVVQEIEMRISTQAEHLRMQSDLFKAREEKYQSRIRDLEALAAGTREETEAEKTKSAEQEIAVLKHEPEAAPVAYELHCWQMRTDEHDVVSLMKERDDANEKIAILEQELEALRKNYEQNFSQIKISEDDMARLMKEKDDAGKMIAILKLELETARKTYEQQCSQMKMDEHSVVRLMKEKDDVIREIAVLKQELEAARKTSEQQNSQMNTDEDDLVGLMKEKNDAMQEIAVLKKELESVQNSNEQQCLLMKTEEEHDVTRLMIEKNDSIQEIAALKKELEAVQKSYEQQCLLMKTEELDVARLMKEKDSANQEIAVLKQEFEETRKTYEQNCLQMKTETKDVQQDLEERLKEITSLEERLKEVTNHFTESRNRVKELEEFSEAKSQQWSKIQHIYQIFTEFQLGALRELRFSSQSIRQEVAKTQKIYSEEFNHLGVKIMSLEDAAANYPVILAENRKLHNEVQELKGNIRVYCRIRPFLPKQKDKQTIVEYVGNNGELIVMNPSKQGKEGRRSFKFNMVYGPSATQAQVFADIQPLIQSVLDGYNVCIFAYGQTGSGKTYTMTGPDGATEEQWGVNYRALNDLFRISQMRGSAFSFEITVQMVEIYNEQVRDLLSSDGSQKRLGILSTSQPNGLAVPDASMFPVNKPSDVLDLMNIGLKSRAKSSTSMNERSSRSHSIVTIHVRGMDKKSGSSMQSSLHLVDLAGSERVDRSEVTGDRLKEAQHINKSLAALGDVISALSTKSPHVPYRNSKLTQVLQSSLGGQAKTLMFVQLNPDHVSFSESISTLKFAERAYGVELGAAKSSKDGNDVRGLMEQVASLRETITAKDEEIEKLQQAKVAKV